MLVYRTFPHLARARPDEPGHAMYVHPDQGASRWDNRDDYRAMYLATDAAGAIGESFAGRSSWSRAMLRRPAVPGSVQRLAVFVLDDERAPLLDFDDPKALNARSIRPTEIVIRNRPHTQSIALAAHREARWAGVSWWSMHRPQWTLLCLWDITALQLVRVEDLPGHPSLIEAGGLLAKRLHPDIVRPGPD